MLRLETMLKHVKLIDEDEVSTELVSLGSKVKLLDIEFDEEVEYPIVGSTEADPGKFQDFK